MDFLLFFQENIFHIGLTLFLSILCCKFLRISVSLHSNWTDDTGSSNPVNIRGMFILAHSFQNSQCGISIVKDQSLSNLHLMVHSVY